MKILVISLAGIGDTLLATPLIHELRLNFPKATLDVLVMWAGARDLLEGNPHVNTVYYENLINVGNVGALRFLRKLRRQRYDISINTYPQSKMQYRMVARFVGARERLSHRYDNASVMDRLFVNRMVAQSYELHSVENNLKFLGLLGAERKLAAHDPEIFLTPAELDRAKAFAGGLQIAGRKILGIHVGSGKTKNLELRRWPLENFIELIKRVVRADDQRMVLLFGGPEEQSDHEAILEQTRHPSVQVAPGRNLREAAALLQQCDLFLSVDTALMHVAAAMKVPGQVVIETPTFNKTIEPYQRPYRLVPNPKVQGRSLEYYRYDGRGIRGSAEELRACMRSVTVEMVWERLQETG